VIVQKFFDRNEEDNYTALREKNVGDQLKHLVAGIFELKVRIDALEELLTAAKPDNGGRWKK
jgi:hypothetical protein